MQGKPEETTGPEPVTWARKALATAEGLPPDMEPPSQVWEATADDSGALEGIVWGEGTPRAPFAVTVRYRPPPGLRGRFPTWEEASEFLAALAAPGSTFCVLPFAVGPVMSDPVKLAADSGAWLGLPFNQTSGAPRETIIRPGGGLVLC